jgi:hypothetical protein
MWCGHVLLDLAPGWANAGPWPTGALIRIEDGLALAVPHTPGEYLPPGCCALPDDDDEPLPCICEPGWCGGDDAPGDPCEHCANSGIELPCAIAISEPAPGPGCYPPVDGWDGTSITADTTGEIDESGPDEAQESRAAADWPAEPVEVDRG